jgi:hypothetical protein
MQNTINYTDTIVTNPQWDGHRKVPKRTTTWLQIYNEMNTERKVVVGHGFYCEMHREQRDGHKLHHMYVALPSKIALNTLVNRTLSDVQWNGYITQIKC